MPELDSVRFAVTSLDPSNVTDHTASPLAEIVRCVDSLFAESVLPAVGLISI